MASLRDVGQSLKEAREAQGQTLEEISLRTRITVRHLIALEEGNEADLPETFYIRGFLKKYAECVGLSPKDVADAYRIAPTPMETPPSVGASIVPILRLVFVVGFIAGIIYLAVYFQPKLSVVAELSPSPTTSVATKASPTPAPRVTDGPAVPKASHAPASPHASAATGATAAAHGASPKPPSASPLGKASPGPQASASGHAASAVAGSGAASPKPTALPSGSVTVEITIEERAWVQVQVDGKSVLEGLLYPKTQKRFKGHVIEVYAGNGGGVKMTVNGHDRGRLGERGVVVDRTFKP